MKKTISDVENHIKNNPEDTAKLLQEMLESGCCNACKDCLWSDLCDVIKEYE